jgi:hypothetical protein
VVVVATSTFFGVRCHIHHIQYWRKCIGVMPVGGDEWSALGTPTAMAGCKAATFPDQVTGDDQQEAV